MPAETGRRGARRRSRQVSYPKIRVEGNRVYVLGPKHGVHWYAMRTSLVPVGVAFGSPQRGWAVLDLVPWDDVPVELRA